MRLRKDIVWIGLSCLLVFVLVIVIEWTNINTAVQPKSLVSTFKDDAQTTRAFTWYTENPNSASILQLMKGSHMNVEGNEVRTIAGSLSSISTGNNQQQGVHKAEVTGLEPGTVYSYRVGSGKNNEWSSTAQFTTEAAKTNAFSFINVTDSQGITEEDFALWGHTLNKAFETFPDARFIVHNGDLTEDPADEGAWDHFFGKAARWLARVPLMPVTGNHDEIKGAADRYTAHFNLPTNGSKSSLAGTNYSFDYGTAHIVVLNTESHIKEQTKWLKQDLAGTDKPWKIIAMHRGAYGGIPMTKWATG
ncbi:Calcineurin-like phosphoesterase [Paenibacillus sp. 1_12]|uniref:purple acid phosphatase family protein n=1 Tax=Paenibacillus sp. 1_12 TaxID=1566278 RepID=UPI0008DECE4B|nr:metallophosphoesterase family protein [Paenibacillus sp. 1_12]SFM37262.1 Calcineurin-like phosphoesterase [Paenibacillus sp. 1_12]